MFDQEVQNLIAWTDNLDYDKYVAEWFQLSTSNASENYVRAPVYVWLWSIFSKRLSIRFSKKLNDQYSNDG